MNAGLRAAVLQHFDVFARESRAVGARDQELAEFLLKLSARWLNAHGVANANIHKWIETALNQTKPLPLMAAARANNDFGQRR